MPRSRRQTPRIPPALRRANQERAKRARAALTAYIGDGRPDESDVDDLLTDLRHLLGLERVDEAARRSKYHFHAEAVCPDDVALRDTYDRAAIGIKMSGSKPRRGK